jgi:hypothetical protein
METATTETETRRRIIYSIELEPTPDSPPGSTAAIVLPLNRAGMSTAINGKPRPLKTRTIDLRVADFVLVNKKWRWVIDIKPTVKHGSKASRRTTVRATWCVESFFLDHEGDLK